MSRIIINLAGKKRTGKETAYRLILPYLDDPQEFQFATPLKKFCIEVLGLTEAQCYGSNADRESATKYKWGWVKKEIREKYKKDPDDLMSARSVLQVVGTDLMRESFYADIWAYAGVRAAVRSPAKTCIFTDTRFVNELNATRDVKFLDKTFDETIIIRLYRDTEYTDFHESEIALDQCDFQIDQRAISEAHTPAMISAGFEQITPTMWRFDQNKPRTRQFDYLIDNNSGIDNLRSNMLWILKEHKIYLEPTGS